LLALENATRSFLPGSCGGHEPGSPSGRRRTRSHALPLEENLGEDVMPNHNDERNARDEVSRRHLFKQVGIAGAAAALSAAAPTAATTQGAAEPATSRLSATHPPTPRLEALETLTAAEADALEAIVGRLIPTDENGPGATEARAAHYIDRALTGALR